METFDMGGALAFVDSFLGDNKSGQRYSTFTDGWTAISDSVLLVASEGAVNGLVPRPRPNLEYVLAMARTVQPVAMTTLRELRVFLAGVRPWQNVHDGYRPCAIAGCTTDAEALECLLRYAPHGDVELVAAPGAHDHVADRPVTSIIVRGQGWLVGHGPLRASAFYEIPVFSP